MTLWSHCPRPKMPAFWWLCIGALGSFALFAAFQQSEKRADRERFERLVGNRAELVQHRLDDAIASLGLINEVLDRSTANSRRSRVGDFLEPMRRRYPFIEALGVDKLNPAPGEEPGARPAADVAVALAIMAMPAERQQIIGFRLMLPMPGERGGALNQAMPADALRYTSATIDLGGLCQTITDGLRAGGAISHLQIRYKRPAATADATIPLCPGGGAPPGRQERASKVISLAGQALVVEAEASESFAAGNRLGAHVLLAGLLASIIGALQIQRGERRIARDRKLVVLRTNELKQTNQVLIADMQRRKSVEQDLQRSSGELRCLGDHLATVKEEERKRIAREIHDELGQCLLALRIDLSVMHAARGPDQIGALLARATAKVDLAMKAVKTIINDLRPAVLDLGLHAAVEWEVNKFFRHTGIKCELNFHQDEFVLDDQRATTMFRIVQESLTNIARHARASAVQIDLSREQGWLFMTIRDNGVGMGETSRRKPGSFGLIGISERVYALGGAYYTDSAPGAGTTLTITIPVSDAVHGGAGARLA